MNLSKTFKNKKIILTGHTGFKGSWLGLWLNSLGGKIIGISKDICVQCTNRETFGSTLDQDLSQAWEEVARQSFQCT